MRIRLDLSILLVLAMGFFAAVQAQEGVLFVETSRHADGDEFMSTIRIVGDRVRFDSSTPDGEQIVIYRGDMQVMRLIDPRERSYQEITQADLERVGGQLSQMRAMMEEQLRNLPPQQRAMMEQMMRGRMPNVTEAAAPIVYTRVSSGEQAGSWQCDRYEGRRGAEKVQEVCATDWENVDLSAADFGVFQQLGEFFQALSSQFDFDLYQVGSAPDAPEDGAFPGVPVRRTTFVDGRASTVHEITEISRQSFDNALFEVPDGYSRAANPFASFPPAGSAP